MKPFILRYSIPFIVLFACLIAALSSQWIDSSWAYDRNAVQGGELWRLLTANFLHTNWNHLALNMGGLFIIWHIYWDIGNFKWQGLFILVPAVLGAVLLYWLSPESVHYVGLSGALHGTIVAFAIADLKLNRWLGIGVLAGVAIKLAMEQIYGSSEMVMDLIGTTVAVNSHLWGVVSGVIIGIVFFVFALRNSVEVETKEQN